MNALLQVLIFMAASVGVNFGINESHERREMRRARQVRDSVWHAQADSLLKYYVMKRRFARATKKRCEIVNSEKIIRFQYKRKMYTYRYESSPSYGFGYIISEGKKIYGPHIFERTPEGIEVFQAFWEDHLKHQGESETSILDPKLRKEVIVMGP